MRKWKIPSFGQFEENKQKGRHNWIISKLSIAKNYKVARNIKREFHIAKINPLQSMSVQFESC